MTVSEGLHAVADQRLDGFDAANEAARARSEIVRGFSLPAYYHVSPERYEKDIAVLRNKLWLLVDHESVIPEPGSYVLRNCAGESIILVRDNDQTIRGFFNVCRHRGSIVCTEERGKVRGFICPYHAWSYGLDGALRMPRSMPEGFDPASYGLIECHIGVTHGLIFANLGAGPPPDFQSFSERFTPFLVHYGIGDAKVAERKVFTVAANWKGVVDNLGECYHCTPAHPTYARAQVVGLVPLQHEGEWQTSRVVQDADLAELLPPFGDSPSDIHFQGAGYHEIGRGRGTVTIGGYQVAPIMGKVSGFDGVTAGMTFNPLCFLISFPDYSLMATFVPRSVARTDIELTWLVSGLAVENVDFYRDAVSHLWTVTTAEDATIISDAQTGMTSSAYRPGPLSLDEAQLVELTDWYLQHFVDVE